MPNPSTDCDPLERGLLIGARLADGREVTTAWIRQRFGVSHATAKRDMVRIELTLAPDVTFAENGATVLRINRTGSIGR